MAKDSLKALLEQNANVLATLAADPNLSEALRVKIFTKLLDDREQLSFFDTMFEENLDLGECPNCGHTNHWLIPEVDLNVRGWVSAERDEDVKKTVTAEDCPTYEQACSKKKVTP